MQFSLNTPILLSINGRGSRLLILCWGRTRRSAPTRVLMCFVRPLRQTLFTSTVGSVLLFQLEDVNGNLFFQLESIVKGQSYL